MKCSIFYKYLYKTNTTNLHFQKESLYEITQKLINKKNCLVTAINPYSIVELEKSKINISYFDYIFIDGFTLCKLFSLFEKNKIKRISMDFSSLLKPIFEISHSKNLKIAIIGASQNEVESAKQNILQVFPNLKLILANSGYFESLLDKIKCQKQIIETQIDIVICGMGSIKQELFLIELKKLGFNGLGLTCGGFIKQTAKKLHYYPLILNKLNLRWLYRIIDEPYLLKRYIINYNINFIYICWDLLIREKK